MSMRPRQRAKVSLHSPEQNPINTNPLGLLILLKDPSRRKASTALRQVDGNRSDDNEASAFSYSSDDESDEDWNEDRRAYLSGLNNEYLLALSLDDKDRHFEPCRKLRSGGPKRKDSRPAKRKNVYKRARDEKENSPRKTSVPEESRHFWTSTSSWSAIGRFFGKLKQGNRRDDGDRLRRLSLQTNSSAADTDDGSEIDIRARSSSYGDPATFLKRVRTELLSASRKHSHDVSHLKVVSKNADDLQFTVTNSEESLAVCKEYFSRLTCYDALPNASEVVAVDTRTPMEEVFNILRRHRTLGAVMWNSSATSGDNAPAQRVCDIGSLVHHFWPYFIDASSTSNVSECVRRPIGDFFATNTSPPEDTSYSFDTGVSAERSLMEAARFFYHHIPSADDPRPSQHRRCYGRFLLPLINELTGDVIHVLSANDILRFLSKELCRFDLTSAFDRTTIADVPRFSQTNSTVSSPPKEPEWRLYLDNTLKQATSMLIESQAGVLAVFNRSVPSKPSYVTMLSITDVVDLVAKSGYCNDVILSKTLDDLLAIVPKKDTPSLDAHTAISKVLKAIANTSCDHGSWDSLLPVAVVVNDEGEFAGFLEAEDLLTLVLSLDERKKTGANCVDRATSHDRRDSGVGDEELLFPNERLSVSV